MLHSDLFGAEAAEVETSTLFAKQSSKMLKANLAAGDLLARRGAMIAYQGRATFEHDGFSLDGAGLKKLVKKAVTGEGLDLMRVAGSGEVFLADMAADVHLIDLEADKLSVNGMNILAFSAGLDWDIELVRSAGVVSGGLFNTTLSGTGQVAIATKGTPVALDAGSAPTYADPDAVVCWSAGLSLSYQSSMTFKDLVGRGSGESGQLCFTGDGMVLVQPAENLRYGGRGQEPGNGDTRQQESSPLGGLGRLLGG